jgi:TolA-binding protein
VEKYPDCSLAAQAHLALGEVHMRNRRWEQAGGYLQQFLARYPEARQWRQALILLGTTYERRGQTRTAAELYRTYLADAGPDDPLIKMVQTKLELDAERQVQP